MDCFLQQCKAKIIRAVKIKEDEEMKPANAQWKAT